MDIRFFSQYFMLFAYEVTKVNGDRKDYLVLIYDTTKKWEEVAMVGKIKVEKYNLLTHMEVFL